jgi:imidazolonepropionase-like amidohydrolase
MKRLTALLALLPFVAVAQPAGSVLIKNATLVTITQGDKPETDLLVVDGKIKQIGKNITAPKDVEVIDASGKFVMPGIIDAHSHLAIDRGINEWTHPVTAEVSMEDVVDPLDISIQRALAGGVTGAHIMHGSANVIGGQNETIKLRYGLNQDEMKMKDAPRTIKFALGENPTRVHGVGFGVQPRTRMGVEQIIREHFDAAQDYRRKRTAYLAAKGKKGATAVPVAKNERFEVLADIIEGKVLVHCHSYRSDEIHMLMRVFRDYGIKNYTFQHVLEGYKVAPEMKKHQAHASTFADWWAYKFEVYYATAYNAAIMHKEGVVVSINSDSEELIRHLNHEAAKIVKYSSGEVSREDALKMITLNPAIQLGIDKRVGSLEPGKEADFAIWSADPISMRAMVESTWVDGKKYFDVKTSADDQRLRVAAKTDYNGSAAGRHEDACMKDVFYFFGKDGRQKVQGMELLQSTEAHNH